MKNNVLLLGGSGTLGRTLIKSKLINNLKYPTSKEVNILKQASIKVYCSQKKQWEADSGLPCIHHKNINETRDRSLPSLAEASKTHGANSTITSTRFGSEKQSL